MAQLGPTELLILATFAMPVALVVIALTRNRPNTGLFARVNDLALDPSTEAPVGAKLARTRRCRVLGTWVGLTVGTVVGIGLGAATGVATGWSTALCATSGILVGTFVGVAAAQRTPRREPDAVRHAALTVRDVDGYRTPHGSALIRAAIAVFLSAVALVLVATTHDVVITLVATGIVAAGCIGFVTWAQRLSVHVVEQARDANDPVHAAVDDVLRAGAVRSIQHATVGVLACGIGLLALLGINTQSYEAVKIDGRTVFTVPDGGHLDGVNSEPDLNIRVTRTTTVTIRWTDADGVGHATTRPLAPTAYLGFGNYFDSDLVISLGGLGLTVGWTVGIIEWSRASKAWRRPAAPRNDEQPATFTLADPA